MSSCGRAPQTCPMTMMRKAHLLLAGIAVLVSTACGGDDDGGDGGSSSAPDIDAVQSCLEAGGLTTSTDSVIPADTREMLGIEGGLTLSGDGDLVGLGSITWYVDAKTATEAHEASAAVRTEEVARAVNGTVAWDYVGSDAAVTLIEGCLAPGS